MVILFLDQLDCRNLSIHVASICSAVSCLLSLTGFSDLDAVQCKIMKHMVRLGSYTEKGNSRIGGVTIARLFALLESSKAFHNVMLRHSIFSVLQVLAGRCDMLLILLAFFNFNFNVNFFCRGYFFMKWG